MSETTILSRIRSALDVEADNDGARREAVAARLAAPPGHPRPAFATLTGSERDAQLRRCLAAQGVEVIDIESLPELPHAVTRLVATLAPAPKLVMGTDERLTRLVWSAHLTPKPWSPDQTLGDGTAALSHAMAAVAETGTLVLASGAANPASLAFLPELHIVAVDRATITAAFEDVFERLAAQFGQARFPRSVNLISGPSRTGDIGGRIVKGAHGPRRLAVVFYGEYVPA